MPNQYRAIRSALEYAVLAQVMYVMYVGSYVHLGAIRRESRIVIGIVHRPASAI